MIDRSRDDLGRDTGWTLGAPASTGSDNSATYTYGPTDGRLASVSGGGFQPPSPFHYSYLPNSNLLSTITGPTHTVTNTWEATRDVLASKENKVGTTVISGYTYNVNHLGQRTGVSQAGTAFQAAQSVDWGYNSKGEVVKADSSVNASDRSYQYDGIGNRLKSADSLTLPTSNNYSPNALNQYSSLTINSQQSTLNPSYDDDGNATAYPLPANVNANSTLSWDAENRLISTTVNSATTTYLYDSQSRRIAQTTGGATTLYVYDGWNPIAEYSAFTLSKTYTWGMDLSGSMQGAGGVGGLLAVKDATGNYFPTYDGNGNISEYLDAAGAIAAHYEYDPFGREVVSNGTNPSGFAHRFSTKPLDITTGLLYYGYRYYDPVTGRWPSRDPIEERGGINLYGFVRNDCTGKIDYLGNTLLALPVITAAQAAAAAFGLLVVDCLRQPACREAMRQAIEAAVLGLGHAVIEALKFICRTKWELYKIVENSCQSCKDIRGRGKTIVERIRRCVKAGSNLTCHLTASQLRQDYITIGCDFLPGNNNKFNTHSNEVIAQLNAHKSCLTSAAANCGPCVLGPFPFTPLP